MLDLDFLDLHPFSMLKLRKAEKLREKRWGYKKGAKKATVNDPNPWLD
jgi:hypothetical protein